MLSTGGTVIAVYDVRLSEAGAGLRNGASVVRETLLATNSEGTNYLNGTAKYEFAKWYYGTLTRANGATQAMVNGTQDEIRSDVKSKVPESRYREQSGKETWNGQTYDYEITSASFERTPNFTVSW